jgi:hypothetical protein
MTSINVEESKVEVISEQLENSQIHSIRIDCSF